MKNSTQIRRWRKLSHAAQFYEEDILLQFIHGGQITLHGRYCCDYRAPTYITVFEIIAQEYILNADIDFEESVVRSKTEYVIDIGENYSCYYDVELDQDECVTAFAPKKSAGRPSVHDWWRIWELIVENEEVCQGMSQNKFLEFIRQIRRTEGIEAPSADQIKKKFRGRLPNSRLK